MNSPSDAAAGALLLAVSLALIVAGAGWLLSLIFRTPKRF